MSHISEIAGEPDVPDTQENAPDTPTGPAVTGEDAAASNAIRSDAMPSDAVPPAPEENPRRRKGGGFARGVRKWRRRFLVLIGVLLLLFGAFLYGRFRQIESRGGLIQESEPVISSHLLMEYLRNVQDLVTVEYHYMRSNTYENSRELGGWSIPFTSKKFSVVFCGVIKSGVDMSRIRVEVNDEEKRIDITLPEAHIVSHEIPEDNIVVVGESSSIFNPLTIDNYNAFTREQKAAVEQEAVDEKGILDDARDKAAEAVEALLKAMPGMEAYSLEVH